MTDYKFLDAIFGPKKVYLPLSLPDSRDYLLFYLHNYIYDILSTQQHGNADLLSRLLFIKVHSIQQDNIESIVFNICQVDILPVTQRQLRNETKCDSI